MNLYTVWGYSATYIMWHRKFNFGILWLEVYLHDEVLGDDEQDDNLKSKKFVVLFGSRKIAD